MDQSEERLLCPNCKQSMVTSTSPEALEPGQKCQRCAMLFLTHQEMQSHFLRLQRSFVPAQISELKKKCRDRLQALKMSEIEVRYFECPICSKMMSRKAFSAVSAIVVHQCALHGVLGGSDWLQEAGDFISHGGEILALQEEIEKVKRETQQVSSRLAGTEAALNEARVAAVFAVTMVSW